MKESQITLADGTPQLTQAEYVGEIKRVRMALALDALEVGSDARALYLTGTVLMIVGRDLVLKGLGRDQAAEFFRAALRTAEAMREPGEATQ